jgi:uncharacterized protein involved in exopolysaccharide biosynthesis
MTVGEARDPAYSQDDESALLESANTLLRWRRSIVILGVLGAAAGLAWGLTSPRLYKSTATFIPQGSEASGGAVALAASQFGIRLPAGTDVWGRPLYVWLLRSPGLLEPLARDTFTVVEQGNRRIALMNLLEIEATTAEDRLQRTIAALQGMIKANEEVRIGAVRFEVRSRWPSVSAALARRLLQRVNEFNLETRKSQAGAESQFVGQQATAAERALRQSEDALQSFLQRNRVIDQSPMLMFERDRLQREVNLRQNLYNSWLQGREDARIRQVRDTPVITVLEEPRVPILGEARGTLKKGIVGGFVAAMLGVLAAFLSSWAAASRTSSRPAAREFFRLLDEATPRFLKRRRS